MPSFTKKAIVESFLHVAAKKPLDKITVRDIVDDCGVNRNTFYYYFQDIYAVLEEICREGIGRVPSDAPLDVTLSTAFEVLSHFCEKHPRVMRNLAISVGREGVEKYFAADLDRIIEGCLLREVPGVTPAFARGAAVAVRHAFTGVLADWVRADDRRTGDETAAVLAPLCRALTAAIRSEFFS